MMVTVGYIIRSIDFVTSYLLLSPVRHHNHLRTGSCCGAVVPGNVTRPHPRSAYVEVSPHYTCDVASREQYTDWER